MRGVAGREAFSPSSVGSVEWLLDLTFDLVLGLLAGGGLALPVKQALGAFLVEATDSLVDGRVRHVVQARDVECQETAIGQQHHVCPHCYATDLFPLHPLQFGPFLFGRLTDGSMQHETVAPFIGGEAKPFIASDP
jgi:hypothetical protein